MEGKTHVVGGIAAGLLAQSLLNTGDTGLFLGACAAGALLPDICHPQSKIGRKLPILSFLVSKTFGHRTFTHSLLFVALLIAASSFLNLPISFERGIIVGVASHLLLDAMTKDGIQFLYPIHIRIRFPITIRTGGFWEYVFLSALTLFIVYYGYDKFI
jgi:inner membrane protein